MPWWLSGESIRPVYGRSKVQFLSGTQIFFSVQCSWHVDHIISYFFTELKIYRLPNFFFYLTLSLPECLMEFWNVTLTFEYVDKILWCDHSNENSLPVLSHDAICFSKFHKIKFGNLAEVCFWLNLVYILGLLYYVRANNDEGLTLETSPFQ